MEEFSKDLEEIINSANKHERYKKGIYMTTQSSNLVPRSLSTPSSSEHNLLEFTAKRREDDIQALEMLTGEL